MSCSISGTDTHSPQAAIAPGASYTVTASFTTSNSTAAGSYTFFVKTDGHNAAYTGGTNTDGGSHAEANKANNVASVAVKLDADLQISGLTLGTVTANSNGTWTIPVTYTVTNVGKAVTAAPNWYDVGYLSADGVLDNNDQSNSYLHSHGTALAPGASYTITANFTTNSSTAAGSYTFFVKTDGHNAAYTGGTNTDGGSHAETNKANNVASATVALH